MNSQSDRHSGSAYNAIMIILIIIIVTIVIRMIINITIKMTMIIQQNNSFLPHSPPEHSSE